MPKPDTHTLQVSGTSVILDGQTIGYITRIDNRTYNAFNNDGNLVAENCYGNGGAKYNAASLLAMKLNAIPVGESYITVDAKGDRAGGGPWTVARPHNA
jgi:hypothetical protein